MFEEREVFLDHTKFWEIILLYLASQQCMVQLSCLLLTVVLQIQHVPRQCGMNLGLQRRKETREERQRKEKAGI